jgi:hypothetical protein
MRKSGYSKDEAIKKLADAWKPAGQNIPEREDEYTDYFQ